MACLCKYVHGMTLALELPRSPRSGECCQMHVAQKWLEL